MQRKIAWVFVIIAGVVASRVYYLKKNSVQVAREMESPKLGPISWVHSAPEIETGCRQEIEGLRKSLDELAVSVKPEEALFSNTILVFENITSEFMFRADLFTFYKYVATDETIRNAADECEKGISKFFVEVFGREDLYKLFKAAAENSTSLPELDALMTKDTLDSFIKNGLALDPEARSKFIELRKELVDLESNFSTRLNEWNVTTTVGREELLGLGEDFIAGLKKEGEKYVITLKYPHYYPIMQECSVPETRKKILTLFEQRGGEDNRRDLVRALSIRAEMAEMLGFKSHAHLKLEDRMAKTPEAVKVFIDGIKSKLIEGGKQDLNSFAELKKADVKNTPVKIEAWDWRYYANQIKKTKYSIDEQQIKSYFPMSKVLSGMFEIYQGLLGVTFRELPDASKWHPEVKVYEVIDGITGHVSANFYMDLFPREGKYGHAAAFTLIKGKELPDGSYRVPVSAIVANFNPPGEGGESLLQHNEVETMFHEFGHIMHQVLTHAKYASYSGTAVKRDFVEAPSQMLESWVWKKESLKMMSAHFQSGEPLPEDLLDKMLAAKLANVSITYLRQLFYASLDLELHSIASGQKVNTGEIWARLQNEIMQIPVIAGTYPEAGFGHLMGGYDSGYYGYLWSEVFAADMFTKFESEGLLNPATGMSYRKWILQPGGSVEPDKLIEGFLGRKSTPQAFLKSIGLE